MKTKSKKGLNRILILLVALVAPVMISWGVWGHERINRAAVLALPDPLLTFFYNHIDFITQEASVPDLRKYTLHDKAEGPRHFVDLEYFGTIDSLPLTFDEAKTKYGDEFLQRNGVLPWYIMEMMDKLTKAFKDKRKNEILFIAADLGHYIGDAHMPFHCTSNYNGQLTNQKGIHSLFESQIPELFGRDYNLYAGKAKYIDDLQKEIWSIIEHSNALVDSALAADLAARNELGDKVFVIGDDGKPAKNKFGAYIYSPEFVKKFNENLNGMIEQQIKLSINATASFWYTAWVNAGKPDLSDLDPSYQTKANKKSLKKELKLYNSGEIINIASDKEF